MIEMVTLFILKSIVCGQQSIEYSLQCGVYSLQSALGFQHSGSLMQFNEVSNKEHLHSLVVSSIDAYAHVSEFNVLVDCRV